MDIRHSLDTLSLGRYAAVFDAMHTTLSHTDLRERGVEWLTHRRKILKAIAQGVHSLPGRDSQRDTVEEVGQTVLTCFPFAVACDSRHIERPESATQAVDHVFAMERAATSRPDDADMQYGIACILARLGSTDEPIDRLDQYAAL